MRKVLIKIFFSSVFILLISCIRNQHNDLEYINQNKTDLINLMNIVTENKEDFYVEYPSDSITFSDKKIEDLVLKLKNNTETKGRFFLSINSYEKGENVTLPVVCEVNKIKGVCYKKKEVKSRTLQVLKLKTRKLYRDSRIQSELDFIYISNVDENEAVLNNCDGMYKAGVDGFYIVRKE